MNSNSVGAQKLKKYQKKKLKTERKRETEEHIYAFVHFF